MAAMGAALAVAAARPGCVPVGFAMPLAMPLTSGAAWTEAPLAAVAVRPSARPGAERLAMAVSVRGWRGPMHRELWNGPSRRVALDARQRRPDQAAMETELGMRRRGFR